MPEFRLEGKNWFPVLRTTREFRGNFEDRVVYSLLVGWHKWGPATQSRIGGFLTLDAGEAVPSSLRRLEGWGLVKKVEGGWMAGEPRGRPRAGSPGTRWSPRTGR